MLKLISDSWYFHHLYVCLTLIGFYFFSKSAYFLVLSTRLTSLTGTVNLVFLFGFSTCSDTHIPAFYILFNTDFTVSPSLNLIFSLPLPLHSPVRLSTAISDEITCRTLAAYLSWFSVQSFWRPLTSRSMTSATPGKFNPFLKKLVASDPYSLDCYSTSFAF